MDASDQMQADRYQPWGLRREIAIVKGNVPRAEEADRSAGAGFLLGALGLAIIGLYGYGMWKEREGPK